MNDKFYEQKKEKQDMLINGAMQVFARNGYRHASIDEMVKTSGVSKGLWFHYFESKKGLYSFVVSYGIKYALLEYGIKLQAKFCNLYELMLDIEAVKISLMDMYPYLPLLIISIMEEDDDEALELINDVKQSYAEELTNIYLNADRSFFGDDIDSYKLQELLSVFFDKQMKNYYKLEVFPRQQYLDICQEYIELLKNITSCQ